MEKRWKREAAHGRSAAARRRAPLRDVWNESCSCSRTSPFGVSLLAVWGLLTLIGVIVEQGKDPSFYAGAYAPPIARLIVRLDLDNIYHSAAYIGVHRADPVLDGGGDVHEGDPAPHPAPGPGQDRRDPAARDASRSRGRANVRARIAAFFAARGWQVRKRAFGGTEWTFADKNNWARRGVLVAHVGFLIIAIGTTIYWAKGYSGQFAVLSGQTATIPQNGATHRARALRLPHRSDRDESGHRLPADRLRLRREGHRPGRRRARRGHSRQRAVRRRTAR